MYLRNTWRGMAVAKNTPSAAHACSSAIVMKSKHAAKSHTRRGNHSREYHQANRTITHLKLDGNQIGDAGATALAQALQAMLVV